MPATLAVLSIVFVESIFSAAGVTDQAARIEHKLLSVLVLLLVSVVNCVNTKTSTRLNGFFVVAKFVAVAAVVVAGVAVVGVQVADPGREDVGGRDWFTNSVGFFGFFVMSHNKESTDIWHYSGLETGLPRTQMEAQPTGNTWVNGSS